MRVGRRARQPALCLHRDWHIADIRRFALLDVAFREGYYDVNRAQPVVTRISPLPRATRSPQ
jgi:hypothetical protein